MKCLLQRIAAIGLLTFAFTGMAFAHAHLHSATPASGSSVSVSPTRLTLHFSEGLNLAFSSVKVTNAAGKTITTGKPSLEPNNDSILVVPVTTSLAPDTYTVNWKALSDDGHTTHGTYDFTVKAK